MALNIRQLWVTLAQSRSDESALPQIAPAKEDIAALQARAKQKFKLTHYHNDTTAAQGLPFALVLFVVLPALARGAFL